MADAALEVTGLEVRYGEVPAVRDVSFRVAPGEVLALVGPNGAGKTTTLLTLMGSLQPSGGDIRLHDESLLGLAPEKVARRGLALVPEGRRIFGEFTVQENLSLGSVARPPGDDHSADLDWIYSLFPIVKDRLQQPAGYLSGGQQQQLAIARALIAGPKVLLLDEPTLGLSPAVVDALFAALEEIRRRGVTILMVEQRAQLAVGFADRSRVMRDGRLTLELGPRDAVEEGRLREAYFG